MRISCGGNALPCEREHSRAHRIGQEKQVTVFKLIAQNTIEEKIIKLQQEKQKLSSQILDGEGAAASALTKDDFMEILEF